MANLIYRLVKGGPLSLAQGDANLKSLNDAIIANEAGVASLLSTTDSHATTLTQQAASIATLNSLATNTYTWDTRPNYFTLSVGTIINITDVGGTAGSFWRATEYGWVPLTGSVKLASNWGTTTTPVSVIQSSANAFFSITGGAGSLTIPAKMLIPGHSVLRIRILVRRRGANGTAILKVYLGTVGDTTDAAALSVTYSQNDGRVIRGDIEAGVITTTSMSTTNWVPITYIDSTGSVLGDMTANINTDSSMFIKFAVVSANTSDTFDLIGYSVVLESI